MSALSLSTSVVEKSLNIMGIMVSKRDGSKDIVERSTRYVADKVPIHLPIYVDTQLFVENDMKITWQEIKEIFAVGFKEDLEY